MFISLDLCAAGEPPDKYGVLEVICVTMGEGEQLSFPAKSAPLPKTPASGALAPPSTSNKYPNSDISIDISGDDPDVWLVLRIDGFEMAVSPHQTILQSRSKGTFTFLERPGEKPRSLTLVVPSASIVDQPHIAEDLETLEVLFAQYGVLQEIDRDELGSDGDLKVRTRHDYGPPIERN